MHIWLHSLSFHSASYFVTLNYFTVYHLLGDGWISKSLIFIPFFKEKWDLWYKRNVFQWVHHICLVSCISNANKFFKKCRYQKTIDAIRNTTYEHCYVFIQYMIICLPISTLVFVHRESYMCHAWVLDRNLSKRIHAIGKVNLFT